MADTLVVSQKIKDLLEEQGLAGVEVTIGKGTGGPKFGYAKDEQSDEITVRLKGEALEALDVAELRKKTYEAHRKIEGLAARVEFDDPLEHLEKLKSRLNEFIDKGASIPKSYLEWSALDKELNSGQSSYWSEVEDHAAQHLRGDAFSVGLRINAPENKKAKDKKPILETTANRIDEYVNTSQAEIKAALLPRLKKYLSATMAEDDIKKAVDNLTIESKENYITLMSPEQKAEADRLKDIKAEPLSAEKQKELAESNILSKLTTEQLNKAVPRAFLHSGEKSDALFPIIAGREDMKRAIQRQLKILKYSDKGQQDPDLAKSIDAFLADDVFEKHDYKERDNTMKSTPVFEKSSDPEKAGTVSLTFTLPKGEASKVLAEVSAQAGIASEAAAPATQDVIPFAQTAAASGDAVTTNLANATAAVSAAAATLGSKAAQVSNGVIGNPGNWAERNKAADALAPTALGRAG